MKSFALCLGAREKPKGFFFGVGVVFVAVATCILLFETDSHSTVYYGLECTILLALPSVLATTV